MKKFNLPDHSQVPSVSEQTALKKRLDTRKSEILENMLVEFLFYTINNDLIKNHKSILIKEARKFLKKVGQK